MLFRKGKHDKNAYTPPTPEPTPEMPDFDIYNWQLDALKQPHILIGGTTGAGKSVALHGILQCILNASPDSASLLLIDPKGVELLDFVDFPHTIAHAIEPEEIDLAISWAAEEMDRRFHEMIPQKLKTYNGSHLYIVIDEYVDIKTLCTKSTVKELGRIAAKGRAAKVHVILCTQRPTGDIIDGVIRANFPAVLALRTRNAQESRNLIDASGCESLPKYGKAYYLTPSVTELASVTIPMVTEEILQGLLTYWTYWANTNHYRRPAMTVNGQQKQAPSASNMPPIRSFRA